MGWEPLERRTEWSAKTLQSGGAGDGGDCKIARIARLFCRFQFFLGKATIVDVCSIGGAEFARLLSWFSLRAHDGPFYFYLGRLDRTLGETRGTSPIGFRTFSNWVNFGSG